MLVLACFGELKVVPLQIKASLVHFAKGCWVV